MKIWSVAASGTAVSAPRTPSSAPKRVTATMMKKPESRTAAPWIFGVRMLFSSCWYTRRTTSMITAAVIPSSAQSAGTRMKPAIVAPMFGIMSNSPAISPSPSA